MKIIRDGIPSEVEEQRMEDAIHYLRLRWTACYMLFLDDRLERANNAFLDKSDDIGDKMAEAEGFDALSQQARSRQFEILLAQDLDEFIQRARKDDALIELSLAQKVAEIAPKFNNK